MITGVLMEKNGLNNSLKLEIIFLTQLYQKPVYILTGGPKVDKVTGFSAFESSYQHLKGGNPNNTQKKKKMN